MRRIGRGYPSDLSGQQWKLISDLIPKARTGGRPRTTDVREVLSAIFYVNRTGCAWRYLPREFPPWQTVYMYYRQWKTLGTLKRIHDFLVAQVRVKAGRQSSPSTLIIDCQSAKAQWGEQRGYDGFKKVQGRKRTIIVDTLGLIHAVRVCTAQRRDDMPAIEMLEPSHPHFPTMAQVPLKAFYADGGYRQAGFQEAVRRAFGVLPVLKFSKSQSVCYSPGEKQWRYKSVVVKSNLKPVRWRVERTFAWFNSYRRLTRDYERKPSSSETMIHLGMIQIMLNRLVRPRNTYLRWT